jgi:hypothetical protein
LLFRSKENAQEWRQRMKMPEGELLSFEQVWDLSKLWYEDRLLPEFKGRSIAQVLQIFNQLGLTSQFWNLDI